MASSCAAASSSTTGAGSNGRRRASLNDSSLQPSTMRSRRSRERPLVAEDPARRGTQQLEARAGHPDGETRTRGRRRCHRAAAPAGRPPDDRRSARTARRRAGARGARAAARRRRRAGPRPSVAGRRRSARARCRAAAGRPGGDVEAQRAAEVVAVELVQPAVVEVAQALVLEVDALDRDGGLDVLAAVARSPRCPAGTTRRPRRSSCARQRAAQPSAAAATGTAASRGCRRRTAPRGPAAAA